MQQRKILALLIIFVLAIGAALAYTDTANADSEVPQTACNNVDSDGNPIDDDGDGLANSNDPGCTEPYYNDDSEGDIYDMDASWIFSGNSPPSSSGPSVFYGWEVIEAGAEDSPYKDDSGSSETGIVEQYVEGSDAEWGGGEPQQEPIDISGAGTTDRDGNNRFELINAPGTGTSDTCGDAIRNEDSEGNFDCPEDYGLPDDLGNTVDTSGGSLTSELGSHNGQTVKYDVGTADDFIADEFRGADAADPEDATGACTSDSCNGDSKNFDIDYIIDSPDFYLKDGATEVWKVYPTTSTSEQIDSVTDVGLVQEDVEHYYDEKTTTTCDVRHENCTTTTRTECTSRTKVYEETLDTETVTIGSNQNSQLYSTERPGDYSYDITSNPHSLEFNVKRNIRGGKSDTSYYYECTGESSVEEVDECGEGCTTFSGDKWYDNNVITKATGYDDDEMDYSYTTITFEQEKVFDLNPAANSHGVSPAEALFAGDVFKDNADYTDIIHNVVNDKTYFSWPIFENGLNQGNNPAVSLSRFDIEVDGADNFVSEREEYHTYDADGSNGQGDGYIAISYGSIVGSTDNFLSREVRDGSVTNDFVSNSDVPVPDCPGTSNKCVASVDVSLQNLTQWGSTDSDPDPNKGLQFKFVTGNPHELDASLGVCKMYKSISGDTDVNCQYDSDPGSPTPPGDGACGDEPNEYWAYMEGPEVDESVLADNSGHYEACISQKSQCVLRGNVVNEGRVANVAPEYSNDQYEMGGNSPDQEVCLDLEGTGIGDEGDKVPGDNKNNDLNNEDYGGEWYDIDSEMAQEYLRNEGSSLTTGDSNNDGTTNQDDISYYWRENLNPAHSTYNPEGESEGLAIEDDCGNERFSSDEIVGCTDADERSASGNVREPTFYSFMTEGKRDDDYHPQGEDTDVENAIFYGYVNKLSDKSNQLEDMMETSNYYTSSTANPSIWENSDGSEDAADQWAITQNLNWSISSRGVPYPPWGTYYRETSNQRSGPASGSTPKPWKVFGNSYAAVAGTTMEDDNGNTVDPGDGVWIDPDNIRTAWESGDFRWDPDYNDWRDPITFKMDITGPDSGIGFDTGDGTGAEFKGSSGNQKAVVYGDIYFQGEEDGIDNDGDSGADESPTEEDWEGTSEVGEVVRQHEPPMCGDDQKEYLLEEMGESKRSAQYDGMYACANTSSTCVDMSSTPRIVDRGAYSQANEPDENVGRLKNDLEICEQRPADDTSLWYDQDYGDIDGDGEQDTCRTNDLYNQRGVRWIDADYVQNHPYAVTGGIDDDWNEYIEDNYNTGNSDEYEQKYESEPNQDSWNFGSESPVPSGARAVGNNSIATLGFCGGDDDGEYLVTQQCNTDLCETDRSVIGVAKNPGSCVIDEETMSYDTNVDERTVFEPGSEISVNLGGESRQMTCFNNKWFEDYPIVFNQQNVEVPFGESSTVSFHVINVRDESTTFEVEMLDPFTDDPSAYQYSTFVDESGDSFETTVSPRSSETFYVSIEGSNKAIGDSSEPSEDDLTVRARAVNSDMTGEDFTTVDVVENNATNSSVGSSEPQSVPGIGAVHVVVLILISSAVFFLQS